MSAASPSAEPGSGSRPAAGRGTVGRGRLVAMALAAVLVVHWGFQRKRAEASAGVLWERVVALERCWLDATPAERGSSLAERVATHAELRTAGEREPDCSAPAAAALEAARAHDGVLYRRAPDQAALAIEAARALAGPPGAGAADEPAASPGGVAAEQLASAPGAGAADERAGLGTSADGRAPPEDSAYAQRGAWLEQLDRAACALAAAERVFPVESCPRATAPGAPPPRRAVDAPLAGATGFTLAPCGDGLVLTAAPPAGPVGGAASATPAPPAAAGRPPPSPAGRTAAAPPPSASASAGSAPPSGDAAAPPRRWRGAAFATPWAALGAAVPCPEAPPAACTVSLRPAPLVAAGHPGGIPAAPSTPPHPGDPVSGWLERGGAAPIRVAFPRGAQPAAVAACTDVDALVAFRLRSGAVAVRRYGWDGRLLDTQRLSLPPPSTAAARPDATGGGAPVLVAVGDTVTVAWRHAAPGRLVIDVLSRRGGAWR